MSHVLTGLPETQVLRLEKHRVSTERRPKRDPWWDTGLTRSHTHLSCFLTTKLFLQVGHELSPSHEIIEKLHETEAPTFNPQTHRNRNPAHTHFCIHGPVCRVIRDPGITGKAALHDGIMVQILLAVFYKTIHTHTHVVLLD